MVPATETYGSCKRSHGSRYRAPRVLQQSAMFPATDTYGSCYISHDSRYRASRFLQHNVMVPARVWLLLKIPWLPLQSPTVPTTECHGSCSRDIWINIPWFPLQTQQRSHGFCYRDPLFLHRRPIVLATELHGSCNRAICRCRGSCFSAPWLLLQIPMVPAKDLYL